MLSYRHGFHAGNHADVFKHLVLLELLDYLIQKDKACCYIDTHAGAGLYSLKHPHAQQNAEYQSGIGRLWQATDLPAFIERYRTLVGSFNPTDKLTVYPGSPALARHCLRAPDKLNLFELHSSDYQSLQTHFRADRRIKMHHADGFANLPGLLPPPSRRALVLLDPAYEVKTDYRQVIHSLRAALERFASGVFAIWYPLLPRREARELPKQLRGLPVDKWLDVKIQIKTPDPQGFGLFGSGMFIINPPWTLAERLQTWLPDLLKRLAQDRQANYGLESAN